MILSRLIFHKRFLAFAAFLSFALFSTNYSKAMERLSFRSSSRIEVSDETKEEAINKPVIHKAIEENPISAILQKLNTAVKPCDDFYEYSCGKYDAVVPTDKYSVDTFSKLKLQVEFKVRNLLAENPSPSDWNAHKTAKYFYKSCTSDNDRVGLEAFRNTLKKVSPEGKWPLAVGDKFPATWYNAATLLKDATILLNPLTHSPAIHTLMSVQVSADLTRGEKKRMIHLMPKFGTDREVLPVPYHVNENTLANAYKHFMIQAAVLMRTTQTDIQIREAVDEVFALEEKLRALRKRHSSNGEKVMTIAEFSTTAKITPSFYWARYIGELLSNNHISEREKIVVHTPNFFRDLVNTIRTEKQRVLYNYIVWRAVQLNMRFINTRSREIYLDFKNALVGVKTSLQPRWTLCVRDTINHLKYATSSLFAINYFEENTEQELKDAQLMVVNVRRALLQMLDTTTWMDGNTREGLKAQVLQMIVLIGFPQEITVQTEIDPLYHDSKIKEDAAHVENVISANRQVMSLSVKSLHKETDPKHWMYFMSSSVTTDVNACYYPFANLMVVHGGILQGFPYSQVRPRAVDYASLGWLIGHEISHSLIPLHRAEDPICGIGERGSKRWAAKAKTKFDEFKADMVEQYNDKFVHEAEMFIDGEKVVAESMADVIGIKAAYYAYEMWAQDHSDSRDIRREHSVPDISPQQLFWISAAQFWCKKSREGVVKFELKYSHHAPSAYRVIGAMQNSEEFARDFQCSETDYMNPETKLSPF